MQVWPRRLLILIAAAAGLLAVAAGARAETATLELKRLDSAGQPGITSLYRMVSSQSFFRQLGEQAGRRESPEQAEFSKIVKKEPKYASEYPFRGVLKLGSEQYAFVFDSVAPKPEAKEEKSEGKEAAKEEKKEGEKKEPAFAGYNRLYFDFNHNGDLTDDKVVEATTPPGIRITGPFVHQFPRIDVTIQVDGTPLEYSLQPQAYAQMAGDFKYGQAQFAAAAYREGEITLEGKKHKIVLLDYNSNGRFDDQFKIDERVTLSGGGVYPSQGDILVIDPQLNTTRYSYDVTDSNDRNMVSKVLSLDGKFYDLKVTPTGDKLTLEPTKAEMGFVTNPSENFRALVYGDLGMLKIAGTKDKPIAIPAGEWKLASYTIDLTGLPEKKAEKKEGDKKEGEEKKEGSLIKALGKALSSTAPVLPGGPRPTLIAASGTRDYKAVTVRKGETAVLPFGPVFKPVVKMQYRQGDQVSLAMTIVGSTGEVVTNLLVDGQRPSTGPEFTISTPKGDVIERGTFKYG